MAEYGAELWRACVLVVALSTTVAPAGVVAREFRAADTQNEDYPTVQALNYMGRLVEQRSGGRFKIRGFHSRQLGEEKETIEQTRVGAIDINRTNVALLGGFVPAMNVLAMPFLFRSTEHLQTVLDGRIGHEILRSFEPHGFVGLAFYDSGARSVHSSIRPIFREAGAASSRFMQQDWRDLAQRSREQAEADGVPVVRDFDRKPFEAAMAPIYQSTLRDPAAAARIDPVRKTE